VSIKIPPIRTDRHRQYPAKINENALCSHRQTFEVLCIITDRHTSDEEGFHFWQTYIEGTLHLHLLPVKIPQFSQTDTGSENILHF
jgi:hypothetical protein